MNLRLGILGQVNGTKIESDLLSQLTLSIFLSFLSGNVLALWAKQSTLFIPITEAKQTTAIVKNIGHCLPTNTSFNADFCITFPRYIACVFTDTYVVKLSHSSCDETCITRSLTSLLVWFCFSYAFLILATAASIDFSHYVAVQVSES